MSITTSIVQFVDYELIILRDYINYTEDYFASKKKEIQEEFEKLKATPEDDPIREQIDNERRSYYDFLIDDIIDKDYFNDEFTQRFRYSLVVQIYSIAEKYLSKIENYFKKINKIKSPKGNYIEKLSQIIIQTDIKACKNYDFMVYFTELRNCIIHNDGGVNSDSKFTSRMKAFEEFKKDKLIDLKETKGHKITRYKIVIEDRSSLLEFANRIGLFLQEIDDLVQLHY